MKTIEQLKADLNSLNDERTNITVRMMAITDEIEQRMLETSQHKVGDIIKDNRGRDVRVCTVFACDGDVYVMINHRLPSGGWSKKRSTYWAPEPDRDHLFNSHERDCGA